MSWWDFDATDAWNQDSADMWGGQGAVSNDFQRGDTVDYGSLYQPVDYGQSTSYSPSVPMSNSTYTPVYNVNSFVNNPTQVSSAPGVQAGQLIAGQGTAPTATTQPTTTTPSAGLTGMFGGVQAGLKDFAEWSKNNKEASSLLGNVAGAAGALIGRNAQTKALSAMQQAQAEYNARQTAQADTWNQRANAAYDTAMSNYNPQEMAVRSMAQAKAGSQRQIAAQEAEDTARNRGTGATAANKRRAQIAASTGGATAYMAGLDTGRSAQQGALSAAKGLSMNYGAPLTSGYQAAATDTSGADAGKRLQQLLDFYAGSPNEQIVRERELAAQKGSNL